MKPVCACKGSRQIITEKLGVPWVCPDCFDQDAAPVPVRASALHQQQAKSYAAVQSPRAAIGRIINVRV